MPELWEDKVVVVHLKRPAAQFENGLAINKPRVLVVDGREYLEGEALSHSSDQSGTAFCVNFDEVSYFFVFDSEADYQRRSSDVYAARVVAPGRGVS